MSTDEVLGHLGADGEDVPDAYFVRTGEHSFRTTLHTQGAWSPNEQHMGISSGLLAHEIERNHPREDVVPVRYSFDILGFIPGGEIEVHTRVLRPGRTIELVEAVMSHGGRDCIRLSLWRVVASDTSHVEHTETAALPPVEECEKVPMSTMWPGGYIGSIEAHAQRRSVPGNGSGWLRITHPIVEGEEDTTTARFIGCVDVANGVAPRLDMKEWAFPNVDLSIHLLRRPVSDWVGLDTAVDISDTGTGLTHSRLFDERGPIGRVAQALTVRDMAAMKG